MLLKKIKIADSRIVFISSGGTIYGNKNGICSENDELSPIDIYGWLKLTMEKYIEMYCNANSIKYLIIRPSNPYGRYQNIYGKQGIIAVSIGKILNNEVIEIWGDGKIIRDFISIDALVSNIYKLIESNVWNEVFNIGSGVGHSINEILEMLKTITKREIVVKYMEGRIIDIKKNVLDISKLKRAIKIDDDIDLEEGIGKMWFENLKREENE